MKQSRLTVFAYINQCQRQLFRDIYKSKPYYNVPEIVLNICLMFYHLDMDEWDTNAIARGIECDGNTITKSIADYSERSAYLTNLVSAGIHIWKFRINNIAERSLTTIGLWDTSSGQLAPNRDFVADDRGYGYVLTQGWKVIGPFALTRYGGKCRKGDEIEMIVNFNALSLSYKVNDVDQGEAFKIDRRTKYRGACSLHHVEDSIELLHYHTK